MLQRVIILRSNQQPSNSNTMSLFKTIGKNIKLFRQHKDMTQDELASFTGISRELINYYENGSREIPITNLEKISNWFGIDVADLMEENQDNVSLKVAFAFRADDLNPADYDAISRFQRIISNFQKMKKLL